MTRDYVQFEKEIHVSYILKNLRVLKTIARRSMPNKEWHKFYSKNSQLRPNESSELDDSFLNMSSSSLEEPTNSINTQAKLMPAANSANDEISQNSPIQRLNKRRPLHGNIENATV